MKHVDLKRKFRDLTESELHDPELLLAMADSELLKSISWDDVLRSPRVLILAEAGSGKTQEMREQAKRLQDAGEAAFFVPLEMLDKEGVVEVLDAADGRAFEAWKARHTAIAWLFLDAVDELKLTHGKLERVGLTRFGGHLSKGEYDVQTDGRHTQATLPSPVHG